MTTEIVSSKHLENALQVSISANAAVVSTRSVEIKSEVKSIAIARSCCNSSNSWIGKVYDKDYEVKDNFIVQLTLQLFSILSEALAISTVTRKLPVNSNGRMEMLMCNFHLMGYYCPPNLSIHQNST